jgi:manganese transport protein
VIALNGALIVNAAILVMAAAVFFKHGVIVTEIEQAHQLLTPLLGTALASGLFAIALLASGQSSTLTGTFAGQIVMEGFLNLRLRPWLRRMITRFVAIIPAVITVYLWGAHGTLQLIILSQVILSIQLPFAVIPLIRFTSDPGRMGEFANRLWVKALAWGVAFVILGLNFWYVGTVVGPWIAEQAWRAWLVGPPVVALVMLLGWISLAGGKAIARDKKGEGIKVAADLPAPVYRRILVPLDHSSRDRAAIAHSAAMAKVHGSILYLLHVEEGAASTLFGPLASDAEIQEGEDYFTGILEALAGDGVQAELTVAHGRNPKDEIVRAARRIKADLIVMGAHGHRGLKDLIFGNTINGVRHEARAPVLVVGE